MDGVENRLGLDGHIEQIAERITEELIANANLGAYNLRATVNDGSIVLKGRVETGAERELAELLAHQFAGSRGVINEIER